MKHALVLCSGGLDSVTTANYAKKILDFPQITLLFFNYGQKALNPERNCVKECAKSLGTKYMEIALPELYRISHHSGSLINAPGKSTPLSRKNLHDTKIESKKFYVPARNTVFLSYALSLSDSLFSESNSKVKTSIFVGFKNEGRESFPDTTPSYVKQMNRLSLISTDSKPHVLAPLIKHDKEDIVLLASRLGVDFTKTFSCYTPIKNQHCGTCLACRLRQEGFHWANTKDPTVYSK